MAEIKLHPLSSALQLALPADAAVRSIAQGLAAEHAEQGWRLTVFQRPASTGASAAQLHAAVLATLAKRYPGATVAAAAAAESGVGWQGLQSTMTSAEGRQIRLLTLLDAAVEPPVLLGLVLDAVPSALSASLPMRWLQAGVAPAAPVSQQIDRPAPKSSGLSLSLEPIESEAVPTVPSVPTVRQQPDRPVPKNSGLSLSLEPIESEAAASEPKRPAAAGGGLSLSLEPIASEAPPSTPERAKPGPVEAQASSAVARARFGAREPSAGPVTSTLRPEASASSAPPPMPTANPYQPPETRALETEDEADAEALRAAGRGQRVLIWCVLLNFAARGIYRNPEIPMLVNWAIAVALMAWAFHGVLLIAGGFGYGRGAKLGLLFGSTVPLLGIGLWIWLSIKTTRALKAAGHTVGFFGVKS